MIEYTTAKTKADLEGIYALQKANLKKNLSEQEVEKDGFVTVDHKREVLQNLGSIAPHIIAKDGDQVVGYVLAMTKKSRADIPILLPMFAEFDELIYKGKAVSDYDYMVVGQACVHKKYRGKGVIEGCFKVYQETFAHRYAFSITEIATSNQRSRKAHKKVGFEEVHFYTDSNQTEWVIVLWDWKTSNQNS